MAWAGPGQSQAVSGSFGLAQDFSRPSRAGTSDVQGSAKTPEAQAAEPQKPELSRAFEQAW
jgi:hypothetical protein